MKISQHFVAMGYSPAVYYAYAREVGRRSRAASGPLLDNTHEWPWWNWSCFRESHEIEFIQHFHNFPTPYLIPHREQILRVLQPGDLPVSAIRSALIDLSLPGLAAFADAPALLRHLLNGASSGWGGEVARAAIIFDDLYPKWASYCHPDHHGMRWLQHMGGPDFSLHRFLTEARRARGDGWLGTTLEWAQYNGLLISPTQWESVLPAYARFRSEWAFERARRL